MFAANKLATLLLLAAAGSVLPQTPVPDFYKKIHILSVGVQGVPLHIHDNDFVIPDKQCTAKLLKSEICPGILEALKVTTVSWGFVEKLSFTNKLERVDFKRKDCNGEVNVTVETACLMM